MAKSKLQDLLAQRAELEKQIAHTQRSERADAIGQVRTLMSEYGLTLADIGSKVAASPKTRQSAKAKNAAFTAAMNGVKDGVKNGPKNGVKNAASTGIKKGGMPAAPPATARKSLKGKKTGKVAPKYRDAATGQTWSGRGLQPNWLKAALATGRGIAEFKL